MILKGLKIRKEETFEGNLLHTGAGEMVSTDFRAIDIESTHAISDVAIWDISKEASSSNKGNGSSDRRAKGRLLEALN